MKHLYLSMQTSSDAPDSEDFGLRNLLVRLDPTFTDWVINHIKFYQGLCSMENLALLRMRYLIQFERISFTNWEAIEDDRGLGDTIGPGTGRPALDLEERPIPMDEITSREVFLVYDVPPETERYGSDRHIKLGKATVSFCGSDWAVIEADLQSDPIYTLSGALLDIDQWYQIHRLVSKLDFFQQYGKEVPNGNA